MKDEYKKEQYKVDAGKLLRHERTVRGLSLQEIADRTGLMPAELNYMEIGELGGCFERARRLAEAMQLSAAVRTRLATLWSTPDKAAYDRWSTL